MKDEIRFGLRMIIGTGIILIGGINFIGHIVDYKTMYTWGKASMALPAAICFVMLGIELLFRKK